VTVIGLCYITGLMLGLDSYLMMVTVYCLISKEANAIERNARDSEGLRSASTILPFQ